LRFIPPESKTELLSFGNLIWWKQLPEVETGNYKNCLLWHKQYGSWRICSRKTRIYINAKADLTTFEGKTISSS